MFADLVNCLLRGMKDLEAHFIMRGDAQPAFKKVRRVPHALQEQVENELDKLEKYGVIKKTNRSCWASPTVVTKANNTVRITYQPVRNKFEVINMKYFIY